MATFALTDRQAKALTAYLRTKLDGERFFLSPSLKPVWEVLEMLDPPKPQPNPFAAPKHIGRPTSYGPKRRLWTYPGDKPA